MKESGPSSCFHDTWNHASSTFLLDPQHYLFLTAPTQKTVPKLQRSTQTKGSGWESGDLHLSLSRTRWVNQREVPSSPASVSPSA